MTVIATDGKTMSGDGLSHDPGGLICNRDVAKVRRLNDGRIMGVAGNPFDIDALERWLNDGGTDPFPELQDEAYGSFDLLVLERDGRAFCYARYGRRSQELLPVAIGGGAELAIGAMEAGASPRRAVEIACQRNTGCGGDIVTLALDG